MTCEYGAVAVDDIPDHVVAFGVPATVQRDFCLPVKTNQEPMPQ